MGIALLYYETFLPYSHIYEADIANTSYTAICAGLNVLLTLMIVMRLAMHSRNFRKAVGTSSASSGLYKAVIIMLIESCAFYAVNLLIYIGLWAANSIYEYIFDPILLEAQVRVSLSLCTTI